MVETSLEAVALCGASLLSDAFASVPSPSERGFLSSSPQAEPSVRISRTGVCTENLNPNVTVVKSGKNGLRFDDTAPLNWARAVSYTHLRAHETRHDLVCRLLLEKKKK